MKSLLQPRQKLLYVSFALFIYIALLVLSFARLANDSVVYALLAKHMVLHGDWCRLVYQGADWLDKPHFPFWMAAISFEIFGLGARSYAFPGLCFFALGAWFTWKLAHDLYDENTAWLSSILYMSVLGSLLAVADQKAEVYLMGLLPTASYAWLRFVRRTHAADFLKYGLMACIFTACACMTKGIFVLFIVGIGVLSQLIYEKKWRQIWHWQWLLVGLVCLIFLTPELLALHQQFHSAPNMRSSDHTYASDLLFFFWDSQFGRFLNTGPIQNKDGNPFFFLHNIIWTFLPWCLVLVLGISSLGKNVKTRRINSDVFIWATFVGAFIVFSVTKYQMDYYLFIVFPYAAIGCASWLVKECQTLPKWLVRTQTLLAFLLMLLATGFTAVHFGYALRPYLVVLFVPALTIYWTYRNKDETMNMMALSIASVLSLFAFVVQFHRELYVRYDLGESMAIYTNQLNRQTIYTFNHSFDTYDFFSSWPVLPAGRMSMDLKDANGQVKPFYVLEYAGNQAALVQSLAHMGLPFNRLHIQPLHSFSEVTLPPLFVGQLIKNDAALMYRDLTLLLIFIKDSQ